jgi:hypothetical protein
MTLFHDLQRLLKRSRMKRGSALECGVERNDIGSGSGTRSHHVGVAETGEGRERAPQATADLLTSDMNRTLCRAPCPKPGRLEVRQSGSPTVWARSGSLNSTALVLRRPKSLPCPLVLKRGTWQCSRASCKQYSSSHGSGSGLHANPCIVTVLLGGAVSPFDDERRRSILSLADVWAALGQYLGLWESPAATTHLQCTCSVPAVILDSWGGQ